MGRSWSARQKQDRHQEGQWSRSKTQQLLSRQLHTLSTLQLLAWQMKLMMTQPMTRNRRLIRMWRHRKKLTFKSFTHTHSTVKNAFGNSYQRLRQITNIFYYCATHRYRAAYLISSFWYLAEFFQVCWDSRPKSQNRLQSCVSYRSEKSECLSNKFAIIIKIVEVSSRKIRITRQEI